MDTNKHLKTAQKVYQTIIEAHAHSIAWNCIDQIIEFLEFASAVAGKKIGFNELAPDLSEKQIIDGMMTGLRNKALTELRWDRHDLVEGTVSQMAKLPGYAELSVEKALFPDKDLQESRAELAQPALDSARRRYESGGHYDDFLAALSGLDKFAEITKGKAGLNLLDVTGQKSNDQIRAELDVGLRKEVREMHELATNKDYHLLGPGRNDDDNQGRVFAAKDVQARLKALSKINGKRVTLDDVMGKGTTDRTVTALVQESLGKLALHSKKGGINGYSASQAVYAPLWIASYLSGGKVGIFNVLQRLDGFRITRHDNTFRISSTNADAATMLEAVFRHEKRLHTGYTSHDGFTKIDTGGRVMSVKCSGNHVTIRCPAKKLRKDMMSARQARRMLSLR